MDHPLRLVVKASSSLSRGRFSSGLPWSFQTISRRSPCECRHLHNTTAKDATPVAHPTVLAPPPGAPQAAVSLAQERVARKRQQAARLRAEEQSRASPDRPQPGLSKRFWDNVSVKDTDEGLQIMLDSRPVRIASRQVLILPHSKRSLATSIALEWDQLVSAQQAIKQHYVPLTSLTSRALDLASADKLGDRTLRDSVIKMLMRYLGTDTLLCWAPERNLHEPEQIGKKSLRQRQREMAEPIIAYLQTHIFPGTDIQPILGEESIVPTPQPELTQEVIRAWIARLPAFELAALERGVLATKSLLVAARLLVEWSRDFRPLCSTSLDNQKFGIEQAAEAATMEVIYQTEQWGEVEDTHDVDKEDVRRQLGSTVLLVS